MNGWIGQNPGQLWKMRVGIERYNVAAMTHVRFRCEHPTTKLECSSYEEVAALCAIAAASIWATLHVWERRCRVWDFNPSVSFLCPFQMKALVTLGEKQQKVDDLLTLNHRRNFTQRESAVTAALSAQLGAEGGGSCRETGRGVAPS